MRFKSYVPLRKEKAGNFLFCIPQKRLSASAALEL